MRLPKRILRVGLLLVIAPAPLLAQTDVDLDEVAWVEDGEWEDDDEQFDDLTDLSLEDLMNIDVEVTSVSRKSESLQDAAAAVYVITSEDIRRSGARSIPEALRMAPGIRVARLASGRYSVSARGFSWVYSDKLLVLVDGRSAYSPRFSGTEWSTIDIPVEDIERIEVIRGPGGTMWGSNAVNGVVNIITKSARDVQDESVTLVVGDRERIDVQLRGGTQLGEGSFLRAFARYNLRDAQDTNSTGIESSFDQARAGARADLALGDGSELLLQADAYTIRNRYGSTFSSPTPPFVAVADSDGETTGGVLFGRWTKEHSGGSTSIFQATYAGSDSHSRLVDEHRNQFDFLYQNQMQLGERNDVVWGASFRYSQVDANDTEVIDWLGNRDDKLYAGFLMDEIAVSERFDLTLGAKLEQNPFTDLEFQPSIRALYRAGEHTSTWAAVSRAIQTPAEAYRGARILYAYTPDMGTGFDTRTVLVPSTSKTPESVIAYEAGVRTRLTDLVTLDLAVFYNDYDDVQAITFGEPFFVNGGLVEQPFTADGSTEAESYGFEASARYLVSTALNLNFSYSYIRINERIKDGFTVLPWDFDVETPKHIAHMRAFYDLAEDWELDGAVYYVSSQGGAPTFQPQYRADARLGWRANEDVTFSLAVQGVFHDGDVELRPDFGGDNYAYETGVYLGVTARF